MYKYCHNNEDKDMNCLDFITDHLLNIDGLFDAHDQQDEQRPHTPLHRINHTQASIYFSTKSQDSIEPSYTRNSNYFFIKEDRLPSEYKAEIFRPPVFC